MRITTITTRYEPMQDRILLSVSDADGGARRLWLTRRLARQLVPVLVDGLEAQLCAPQDAPAQAIEAAHVYAQLQARLSRKPSPPVRPLAHAPEHLIDEIGVRRLKGMVRTVRFVCADLPEPAELSLSANELRQWLELLKRALKRANWGLDVFPAWMAGQAG